jgi:hypothetical protein
LHANRFVPAGPPGAGFLLPNLPNWYNNPEKHFNFELNEKPRFESIKSLRNSFKRPEQRPNFEDEPTKRQGIRKLSVQKLNPAAVERVDFEENKQQLDLAGDERQLFEVENNFVRDEMRREPEQVESGELMFRPSELEVQLEQLESQHLPPMEALTGLDNILEHISEENQLPAAASFNNKEEDASRADEIQNRNEGVHKLTFKRPSTQNEFMPRFEEEEESAERLTSLDTSPIQIPSLGSEETLVEAQPTIGIL